MLVFRITINGKRELVGGIEDWSLLTASISANRQAGDIELRVGALAEQSEPNRHEHVRWRERSLSIGDRVEIEMVDASEADVPTKRYRSDRTVQESPFTPDEIQEMKREQYLMLKAEFESSASDA
jgi:hypothetical protein